MNLYKTNKAIRKRIDRQLERLAVLHANNGTESKLDAGKNFHKERRAIQKTIKSICPKFYKSIY